MWLLAGTQAIDQLICCFGPVRGAASLCSQCTPTRGVRCGTPLGFQVWVPTPLIWVRASGLQVSARAAFPEFTVQGLRGEESQRLWLLQRVL